MEDKIDDKMNPHLASLPWTHRRAGMIQGSKREGVRLKEVQEALHYLAGLHDNQEVPNLLAGLKTKTVIADVLLYPTWRSWEDFVKRMRKAGLFETNYAEARALLLAGLEPDEEGKLALELQEAHDKVMALVGQIPGFYVTPDDVADRMVRLLHIDPCCVPAMTVLDPEAGSGALLDAVKRRYPDQPVCAIEPAWSLVELLKLKGYRHIGHDFLEWQYADGGQFDRIIMNPPFENGADMAHVRHAYDCLKENGRLVAIVGSAALNDRHTNAKQIAFREWLSDLDWMEEETLPRGTFEKAGMEAKVFSIDKY